MHPILFDLGPFEVRTYGVLLSLAFLLGIGMSVKRGVKRGFPSSLVYDLSMVIILSAIIGSRAYYVLLHVGEFTGSPLSALRVWEGGLAMDGGIVLSVLAGSLFLRARRVSIRRLADVIAPALAFGIAITRIGCYYNGCCFGIPVNTSLGRVFPPGSEAGYRFPHEAIHPTQLYSSLSGLGIFLILIVVDRCPRREGFLFGLTLVLNSMARFGIDYLRYYSPRSSFEVMGRAFTFNQGISLALLLLGVAFMAWPIRGHRGRSTLVTGERVG